MNTFEDISTFLIKFFTLKKANFKFQNEQQIDGMFETTFRFLFA